MVCKGYRLLMVGSSLENNPRRKLKKQIINICVHIYIYIYVYTRVDLSLYSDIVSGHIARRSDLKLTDSMFCLCIFSSIFSMDGRS